MAAGTNIPASAERKTVKKGTSTFKTVVLKLHLYLGLVSAIFLALLGASGAVIGFEQEIPRWLNPSLYYVTPTAQSVPEAQLIQSVEQGFAPARVRAITMPQSAGLSQVMMLPAPGARGARGARAIMRVFVNQYTGAILGSQTGPTQAETIVQDVHSFHQKIGMGEFGKWLVSVAGAILSFEVLFGLILWLRLKRATIRLKGSWFRVLFDLHNALGIYAALFLFVSAVTGLLIGFDWGEPMLYHLTNSSRPPFGRPPASQPVPGAKPISADQAMAIARQAMPEATIAAMQTPAGPRGSYFFSMRLPIGAETSPAVHSFVTVDQYSGRVLNVYDVRSSPGYVAIRLNRALHTGDILGFPTHLLMSLTSLALVVMVISGIVIWWKKLAI